MEDRADFAVAGAGKSRVKDIEELREELLGKIGPLALRAKQYLPQITVVLMAMAMLIALAYYYYHVK